MEKKMDNAIIRIKSVEQIADAFVASQEKSFPVYRGPNCLSIPKGIRYVKGEVTQEERERFRSHIRTCLYCSRRIESLRRTAEKLEKIDLEEKFRKALEEVETKASLAIDRGIGEQQSITFMEYDARPLILQMKLRKELNIHGLDNLIDPIASVNGNGAIGIVSAKLLNLSQIREATSTPLIITGSSKELNTLFAEPIPEMSVNWKTDILAVRLPEEAQAIWQRQAEQVCERLEGIANPREAILAVLDHGASDEVMPLSWLERMGYLKSNPHPLIEELFEFREVITPINPYLGEITNWEEAQYLTATDGEVARMILERMGRWNGRARTEYYKNLINSVITKETKPLSEDAKLICRLLHALYLRGWRSTLYHVLRNAQKTMKPLLNKLLEEVDDARYLMAWGKVYSKGGDSDTAIELLNTAKIVAEKQDKKTLPYILRVRAGLHLDRDERREAIRDLEKARELQPQNLTILTALAAAHAREYGPRRRKAFKIADEAKRLAPDSPYPYQIAGYARMQLGLETSQRRFFTEAAEEFSQALEKDPNSVPTLTAWAEMAMERGHLRPQLDEYEDDSIFNAEELLLQALDIEPLNVPTLVSLGRLHTELNEYSEAKSYLRQALSQLPQNVKALTALAHLYTQQEDYEKAKETLERAEGVYGESAYIVAERGRIFIKQGETDKAISILEPEVKQVEGLSKVVLLNLLVKAYCKKVDFVTAGGYYTQASGIQPRNIRTYNNWVKCLLDGRSKDDIENIITMLKDQKDRKFHPQIHPQDVAKLVFRLDNHNSYVLEICGLVEKVFGDEKRGEDFLKRAYKLGLARQREDTH